MSYLDRGNEFDVRSFGAKGDGVTDDTAAFQAAFNAASAGHTVFIPKSSSNYLLASNVYFPSGITIRGSRGTTIQCTGTTLPGLCSKGYIDASAPGGRTLIENLKIIGPGSGVGGAGNHGLVIRDYYTTVRNLEISAFGGNALRFTHFDKDGLNPVSSTLVQNHVENLYLFDCADTTFLYGVDANNKLTDAVIKDIWISTNATSTYGITVGSAAGSTIENIHTYGTAPLTTPFRVANCYATTIRGVYVETFKTYAMFLSAVQTTISVSDIHIITGASMDAAGAALIGMSLGGGFTNPIVQISDLNVRHTSANPYTVVLSTSGSIIVQLNGYRKTGTGTGVVARWSHGNAANQYDMDFAPRQDTISEDTADAGVTIDSTLIKDGGAVLADAGTLSFGTTSPAILSRGAANRLDMGSDDGFKFASMTSTTRDTNFGAAPATAGIVIYNTTTSKLQVSSGGAWVDLH